MATKQSTTRDRPWRQSSTALNDRLCEILPKDDDEDGYLLFARPESNVAVVSPVFGAALVAQRECVELTQETVARKAFISIGLLRAIERGARQPTISEFLSICEAIGIDPRELFNCALERMGYPTGFIPVTSDPPSSLQALQPEPQSPTAAAAHGRDRSRRRGWR